MVKIWNINFKIYSVGHQEMNTSLICLLKNKLGEFFQICAFGHIAIALNAIHTF